MNTHSADKSAAEIARRSSVRRVEIGHPRNTTAGDVPGGFSVLPSSIACDASLSTEARILLLVLSAHANDRHDPYPSVARLARLVGRSERQILRMLADLGPCPDACACGGALHRDLVERVHRYRHGKQVSSAYVLRFDRWGGALVDTGDTPRGDTGDTPRGDTGVAQNKTTRTRIKNPPSPPQAGGTDRERAPESRDDQIRRIAREEGVRPREARRILSRREAIAAQPAPPPDPKAEEAEREFLMACGLAYRREELGEELSGEEEAMYQRYYGREAAPA